MTTKVNMLIYGPSQSSANSHYNLQYFAVGRSPIACEKGLLYDIQTYLRRNKNMYNTLFAQQCNSCISRNSRLSRKLWGVGLMSSLSKLVESIIKAMILQHIGEQLLSKKISMAFAKGSPVSPIYLEFSEPVNKQTDEMIHQTLYT